MNRRLPALAVAMALAAIAADDPGRGSSSALPAGYEVIVNRNVFDPNRRPYVPPPSTPAYRPPPPPAPTAVPEYIYLAGAVVSSDAVVALFDGSKPEYRVAVARGEEIGGLSVRDVRTTAVSLTVGDTEFRLAVGQSLKRVGESSWTVSDEGFSPAGKPVSAPSVPSRPGVTSTPTAGGGSSASPSDLMQKLLERRKKELGQ